MSLLTPLSASIVVTIPAGCLPCCSPRCDCPNGTIYPWQGWVDTHNDTFDTCNDPAHVHFSLNVTNTGNEPAELLICGAGVDDNLLINGFSQASGKCIAEYCQGLACPCGLAVGDDGNIVPIPVYIGPRKSVLLEIVDNCAGSCAVDLNLCLALGLTVTVIK